MAAKSFDNENKPNSCMSSWTESKARSRSFFERIARKEPKNTSCLEGISKRIWVAYQRKCYIPVTSHRNSLRDPANRFAFCAFTSFLTRWKFDSAQDDKLTEYLVAIVRNQNSQFYFPLPKNEDEKLAVYDFFTRNGLQSGWFCDIIPSRQTMHH